MNAAKHTPGPWKYDTYNHVNAKGGHHEFAPELVTICSIPDHPDSDSDGYTPEQSRERGWWYAESARNADLIEAAPELLDSLQELHDEFKLGGVCLRGECQHPQCIRTYEVFDRAGEIIRKARGEQ